MFYVALTRAKEHVVVTHARLRTNPAPVSG
ncbi:MAG: hypothetical protein VCF24_20490 [Candidatus Latescibacterota bacterium]